MNTFEIEFEQSYYIWVFSEKLREWYLLDQDEERIICRLWKRATAHGFEIVISAENCPTQLLYSFKERLFQKLKIIFCND